MDCKVSFSNNHIYDVQECTKCTSAYSYSAYKNNELICYGYNLSDILSQIVCIEKDILDKNEALEEDTNKNANKNIGI